jgi:hypothetical protein
MRLVAASRSRAVTSAQAAATSRQLTRTGNVEKEHQELTTQSQSDKCSQFYSDWRANQVLKLRKSIASKMRHRILCIVFVFAKWVLSGCSGFTEVSDAVVVPSGRVACAAA